MYNFYRWYPAGKIVFLAPTKPLVAQQIEACYRVMGIPQQHMAELTGSSAAVVCAVVLSAGTTNKLSLKFILSSLVF